jgi:hypothetical protein
VRPGARGVNREELIMAGNVKIDERFLEPLESMMLAMEMSEVPLLVMQGGDSAVFADQAAAAMGGTVVYTSQPDFVKQTLASITGFDYLWAVIDEPLTGKPYQLIRAYLAARDILGADPSALAGPFHAAGPHPEHRLILFVDRTVFDRQPPAERRELAELCRVIAMS